MNGRSAISGKRAAAIACLALTLGLAGCRKDREWPSRLIDKTYSYQSLERVQRETGIRSWNTLEDRRPLPSDTRPPFRIFRISVPDYTDLGYKGELRLMFFNDRLMRVAFYPEDLAGYKQAVQEKEGFRFSDADDADIGRDTHVWIGKELDKRMYIGWEDKRLKKEYDDWVRQYVGM